MKKIILSISLIILSYMSGYAVEFENDFSDDVKFAIQMSTYSVYPEFKKLEKMHGPGRRNVSILEELKYARQKEQELVGHDHYTKFVAEFGGSGQYEECEIYLTPDRKERNLYLSKKTDEELIKLDTDYKLIVFSNKKLKFLNKKQ